MFNRRESIEYVENPNFERDFRLAKSLFPQDRETALDLLEEIERSNNPLINRSAALDAIKQARRSSAFSARGAQARVVTPEPEPSAEAEEFPPESYSTPPRR